MYIIIIIATDKKLLALAVAGWQQQQYAYDTVGNFRPFAVSVIRLRTITRLPLFFTARC